MTEFIILGGIDFNKDATNTFAKNFDGENDLRQISNKKRIP